MQGRAECGGGGVERKARAERDANGDAIESSAWGRERARGGRTQSTSWSSRDLFTFARVSEPAFSASTRAHTSRMRSRWNLARGGGRGRAAI